jgi:hypothetical protein
VVRVPGYKFVHTFIHVHSIIPQHDAMHNCTRETNLLVLKENPEKSTVLFWIYHLLNTYSKKKVVLVLNLLSTMSWRCMHAYIHIFLTLTLFGEELSASWPCQFTHSIDWSGGWVGPRTGLNRMEKRKISLLPECNLWPSATKPTANHYIGYSNICNILIALSIYRSHNERPCKACLTGLVQACSQFVS